MPGRLYNARNVTIGTAVGYYARSTYAAMAPDTAALFDPMPWCGTKLTFGGTAPTSGALVATVKTPRGVATASIPFGSLATVAAATAALQTALAALPNLTPADVQVVSAGTVVTVYVAGSTAVTFDTTGLVAPTSYVQSLPTWTTPGGTTEGFQIMHNKTSTPLYIEETPQQVAEQLASQQLMFGATLAEDTLTNLALLMNMQATQVARVAGTVAQKTILSGLNYLPDFSFCLETANLAGLRRNYYVPSAKISTNNTWAKRRAAALQTSAFQVRATCDAADIQVVDFEVAA